MAVRSIRVYQSEDGKTFESMADAVAHDSQQRAMAALKTALQNASPASSLGTIHIDLANKPVHLEALRDACNKALDYHRRHGKLKKK